jgi:hypothetical protein
MSTPNASDASKLKIGLVQINNSFSGQNYLPYSIALLQTYVQKFSPHPSPMRSSSSRTPTLSASAPTSGTAASRSRLPGG